jgi:ribosomal protein S14
MSFSRPAHPQESDRSSSNCGRTEGVWNAFLVSRVAQSVREMEEDGVTNVTACGDIPDWARITGVTPVFDPIARKATLTYCRRHGRNSLIRETVEEVIE